MGCYGRRTGNDLVVCGSVHRIPLTAGPVSVPEPFVPPAHWRQDDTVVFSCDGCHSVHRKIQTHLR